MMLEELYEPLPDIETYLNRIEMNQEITMTKACLDQLIYLHQCHIPFENLDVYFAKKPISIGIRKTYEKIVLGGRGGYCFEMNGLFCSFLKALGFHAYSCMCKVIEGDEPRYPALHRGTIVTLEDDLYYCDIGFGGPVPGAALRITADGTQTYHGDTFRLIPHEYAWYRLERLSENGSWAPMIYINTQPQDPADFIAPCHYCCCHTQKEFNHFTDELLLNIRTPDGYYSITNQTLKQKKNGIITIKTIREKEELIPVIKNLFRITDTEILEYIK